MNDKIILIFFFGNKYKYRLMYFFNVLKVNKFELFVNFEQKKFVVNDFLIIGYIFELLKRNFLELIRCIDRGYEYLYF